MKKGFLLFAYNNESVDYVKMAIWTRNRLKRYYDLPVCLVTDSESIGQNLDFFDYVILSDCVTEQKKLYNKTPLTFRNINRSQSYQITPFEETIILDTDIFICSNKLNALWHSNLDVAVCKNCIDVFGRNWAETQYINTTGIEFYWASICYFKKNYESKVFFDYCRQIADNYDYYQKQYNLKDSILRNDHVWSIASHWYKPDLIPSQLWYSIDRDSIVELGDNYVILENEHKIKIYDRDVHIMNKLDLLKYIK